MRQQGHYRCNSASECVTVLACSTVTATCQQGASKVAKPYRAGDISCHCPQSLPVTNWAADSPKWPFHSFNLIGRVGVASRAISDAHGASDPNSEGQQGLAARSYTCQKRHAQ